MKVPSIKVPRSLKKSFYLIGKHKSEIGTAVAVVSSVAAFGTAINSTFKADDVIKQHKQAIAKAETAKKLVEDGEVEEKEYPEETYKNDIRIAHKDFAVGLIKVYAVPVALETLNIVATIATHRSLRKANVGLTSAYIGLDKAFKEYRRRVRDQYGEEADNQLYHGYHKEKIEFEEIDPETGKSKKVKEEVNVFDKAPDPHMYSVIFDRNNLNWTQTGYYNESWLRAMEQSLNDRLRYSPSGFVTLNEVYEALGFPTTKEGMVVGWRYCCEPDGVQDNYIEFKITPFITKDAEGQSYAPSNPRLLIDFNVDGPIYDYVKDKKTISAELGKSTI